MYMWSYCYALIQVYSYDEYAGWESVIQTLIDNAPKITGSECDATVKIVDKKCTQFSSRPCRSCPCFNPNIDKLNRKWSHCPGIQYLTKKEIFNFCNPMTKKGNNFESNNVFYIMVRGALRNKTKSEIIIEFNNFIKYLKNAFPRKLYVEVLTKRINQS